MNERLSVLHKDLTYRVQKLCDSHNVSVNQLSEIIGVTPSAASNKKAGRRQFTTKDLFNIANHFGVSVDYLLGRDSEEAVK